MFVHLSAHLFSQYFATFREYLSLAHFVFHSQYRKKKQFWVSFKIQIAFTFHIFIILLFHLQSIMMQYPKRNCNIIQNWPRPVRRMNQSSLIFFHRDISIYLYQNVGTFPQSQRISEISKNLSFLVFVQQYLKGFFDLSKIQLLKKCLHFVRNALFTQF